MPANSKVYLWWTNNKSTETNQVLFYDHHLSEIIFGVHVYYIPYSNWWQYKSSTRGKSKSTDAVAITTTTTATIKVKDPNVSSNPEVSTGYGPSTSQW